MRLKTYTAPTTAEAMRMVRDEMGEDAIIVSVTKSDDRNGVRVTAAVEREPEGEVIAFSGPADDGRGPGRTIRRILADHGVPEPLTEHLAQTAGKLTTRDPVMAFAGALDECFFFAPLSDRKNGKPIMLVGPPGGGKTITTAKLAARSILAGNPTRVLTIDTKRAGGIEQLAAFTRILGIDLQAAEFSSDLADLVAQGGGSVTYIDSMGTNPFSDAEMEALEAFIGAADAEPVLVLPAGGDVAESADIAASFAAAGAQRLLITRLDMARRLGGILAAADAARLKFCDVSINPNVADGLSPINPVSLARLIMPDLAASPPIHQASEAAL